MTECNSFDHDYTPKCMKCGDKDIISLLLLRQHDGKMYCLSCIAESAEIITEKPRLSNYDIDWLIERCIDYSTDDCSCNMIIDKLEVLRP